MFFRVLRYLACSLAVTFACAGPGARHLHAQQKKPEKTPIRTGATIKGMAPGGLYVMSDKGDQYAVKLPNRGKNIVYEGTADASWLRPGMLVEFTGNLNRRGQAVDAIRELLVFTPSEEHSPGLQSETGGIAGDLFSEPAAKGAKRAPETAPFRVAGALKSIRRNRLEVLAGNSRVEAELADNAKIRCELADLSLVREGDSVVIDGWFYPMDKTVIYANKLTISGAQTLTNEPRGMKKKGAPPKDGISGEPDLPAVKGKK